MVYLVAMLDALANVKRSIRRGRPTGTTTYEAEPAIAFGAAVREERTNQGIAQETLAHMAGIERSHMGKIERGEHVPTLPHPQDRPCAEMQFRPLDDSDRSQAGRVGPIRRLKPARTAAHPYAIVVLPLRAEFSRFAASLTSRRYGLSAASRNSASGLASR